MEALDESTCSADHVDQRSDRFSVSRPHPLLAPEAFDCSHDIFLAAPLGSKYPHDVDIT